MIKLICVGKIKEKYLKEAIFEYTKRLSRYTKIEIIEVNDVDVNNPSISLLKEKEEITKHISEKDFIITMDITADQLTSTEFSEKLDKILISNPNICFIIGGSHGIDQEIKEKSNYRLSFSKMTFPHQLFRVILLEQIYRAYKILKNESYHK
jgi:23S rRNA (pseudouridine1915-N3)-methyltransferase